MRVLLLGRVDAAVKPGGDLTIMRAYARHLPALGCEVTITHRLDAPVEHFDVVHLFGLDCCLEPFVYVRRAQRAARRPALVLTPLEHRLAWVLQYHQRVLHTHLGHPQTAAGIRFNGYFTMRDIARYLLTARHHPGILPHLPHLAHSCYHRRRSAASAVDALCVHAPEEAQAVTALLDLPPIPSIVAPIGRSDPEFAPVPFDRPTDYLLCVGRIEPLKNQLAILDAAISLGAPVLFVGALNKRHRGYCARFTTAVARSGELARHVPHLDHRMVNTLYRDARAHVLASWGEVFPLTTVEAVSAGCPVVTTANSYEHHVYGDAAHYCDPGSSASIRDALAAVLAAPRRETVDALRARIPLWTDVVASVAHGYRSLAAQPRGARPLPEPPGPERGRRDDGLQISSTESPWKQT